MYVFLLGSSADCHGETDLATSVHSPAQAVTQSYPTAGMVALWRVCLGQTQSFLGARPALQVRKEGGKDTTPAPFQHLFPPWQWWGKEHFTRGPCTATQEERKDFCEPSCSMQPSKQSGISDLVRTNQHLFSAEILTLNRPLGQQYTNTPASPQYIIWRVSVFVYQVAPLSVVCRGSHL